MKDEKRRELEAWRKEHGFCTKCGNKLPDGYAFVTCEKCRANCRAYHKARKESGLCITCGNKLPDGYTSVTCEDCKKYRNSYRRLLKREQLCVCCRKQDAYTLNKRALCADCSERIAAAQRERMAQNAGLAERKSLRSKELYNSRKEQGLCPKCGKRRPDGEHRIFCLACLARGRRYDKRKFDKLYGPDRLTKQNVSEFGICSTCFKSPAECGKLCESCYAKHLISLNTAREAFQEKCANHPWRAAEGARLEEVRRRHGWEKQSDKK